MGLFATKIKEIHVVVLILRNSYNRFIEKIYQNNALEHRCKINITCECFVDVKVVSSYLWKKYAWTC